MTLSQNLLFNASLALAITVFGLDAADVRAGEPLTQVPQLVVETPCPFEAASGLPPERLTCGHLVVPENRQVPGSAPISLPVAVVHSSSETPRPDPVLFIAGGPGGAPTASARSFMLFASHAFNADRDIVLYTQRGAAMTEPDLDCAAIASRGAVYLEDQTLEERDRTIAAAAVECLHQLGNAGRDLQGYSMQENAQDLVDLRQALGLQQWNLLAVSYGTLIAIETARRDPAGVRSMVLDSLVSPESDLFMSQANRNFSYGLGRLLDACAASPDCQAQFPDLRDALERVLAALREHPVNLPLTVEGAEGSQPMVVNWHDFLGLLHWMLYNAQTLTLVPLLIEETAAGRYELLTALLNRVFPGPALAETGPAGMFFATVCRDQWTVRNPLPAGEPQYGGFAITSFMDRVCSDPALGYGNSPAPGAVSSNVPTLLLSGRFDPMTPDLYAEQVAAAFSRAWIVRIPDYGHSTLSGYTACQTVLARSFLDEPRDVRGFACLAELGPPEFVLTVEEAQARSAPAH